jgi:GNAT superfamily N-acetyltransferase
MLIRGIREADAPAVACLADELGYPTTVAQALARIERALARPDEGAFVAEYKDGSVIGWVHVFAAHRLESDSFAEIGGLVVDEARRRQGVGAALLSAAERWAAERGYARVVVRSNTVRVEARRFYERRGFAEIKSQLVFAKAVTGVGTSD